MTTPEVTLHPEVDMRLNLLDRALAQAKLPEAIEYAHDMWRFVSGQDAALAYSSTPLPAGWMDGAVPAEAADGLIVNQPTDGVIGIALGENGVWRRIDINGHTLAVTEATFNDHPVWGRMRRVVTDLAVCTIEIPHFWLRTEFRGEERMWWVSPREREGFELHPAFLTCEGRSCAVLRVGQYLASDCDGTVKVTAPSTPWTDITIDEARAKCEALGKGWRMWSIYDLAAVQLLALIEMGTPDMQDAIARGNVDGSGVKPTGSTGAVWRGIHDLWGNVWQFTDGLRITADGMIEVWHEQLPGSQAWVNTGVPYGPNKDDGFPADLHIDRGRNFNLSFLFLPSEVTDDREEAIIPDYVWGRWGDRETIAISGGHWCNGAHAGVFALDLPDARSSASTLIGFRPAFAF